MARKSRKPPDGHRRLSRNLLVSSSSNSPRDNPYCPRKQASCPRAFGPGERAASCVGSALDSVPTAFDATANPILAEYWFGVEPFRQIGDVADLVDAGLVVANLKRQRQVVRLHSLGPRPVLEALIEVAAGVELDIVLADYARLDPEVVTALGGDKFPPSIFAVGST